MGDCRVKLQEEKSPAVIPEEGTWGWVKRPSWKICFPFWEKAKKAGQGLSPPLSPRTKEETVPQGGGAVPSLRLSERLFCVCLELFVKTRSQDGLLLDL